MIQLTAKTKLLAPVVALVLSLSVGGVSLTTARTPEHPPVIALAVLPAATRMETERRSGVVRSIRLRLANRLRTLGLRSRRRTLNLGPRLPIHPWSARGPPG